MEAETLIFMPNGDVTLTLIRNVMSEPDPLEISAMGDNSAAVHAPANEGRNSDATRGAEPDAPVEPEEPEDVMFYAPDPPESESFYPPPRRAARGSDASSRRDRSTSPPAHFWASLKSQAASRTDPIEGRYPESQPKSARKPERIILSSHEVHCVVSSRHMILASQYFEKMLSGDSKEATTLRTKRHVSISLPADADAMITLLNIIHGLSRKVPRQVNLEELSKLAVLVSIFGMLGGVQFFSDTWIDNFQKEGLPRSYNESVLQLLFVFWVFDRHDEFKDMSKLTQRECDEKVDEDVQGVPIPHSIIDAIKKNRESAMESAIGTIHTLIDKYMEGRTICDGASDPELGYACDAMVLGSLLKSSRKIGIWPKPEAPFSGRKFKELASAIRSIRILDVCKKTTSRRITSLGPSTNSHGLENSIEASMRSIEAALNGLDLSDYAKQSNDYTFEPQIVLPISPNGELNDEPAEEQETNDPLHMKDNFMEASKEGVKLDRSSSSVSEARPSTYANSKIATELPQQETKVAPRLSSISSQQQELRASPTVSLEEVQKPVQTGRKESPGSSPNPEVKTLSSVIAKVANDPPKGVAKILAEKQLNRVPSFPIIPKDDVESFAKDIKVAPRVVSSGEIFKGIPQPEKPEVKSPTYEVKASLGDALTGEEDEIVGLPNFKMRKSKKRFSTKY